ncbi:MAG: hypothetical protein HY078_08865 [Elusimicrobia bacterium]|nr:hypothetical protein [Elusimicrobiota bacterium]
MDLIRFGVGLFKLAVSVLLSVGVVFITYKVFVKANTDFDEIQAIKDGNTAVGVLVAALLLASANIIFQGLTPLLNLLTVHLGHSSSVSNWQIALYGVGNLLMAFTLSIVAMSFSLRMFGRLTRPAMRAGVELEHGNLAVGILLSGVVLVVGLYIGDGVNALSKAIIPQPTMSSVQIMR